MRLLLVLPLLLPVASASAQTFPSKPIRVILGFAAGGPSDLAVRTVGDDMARRLGQAVVVENRPGATGMIALDAMKDAPADGYTLQAFLTPTVVASILAGRAVPNPAAAFTPIGYIWQAGLSITVNPAAPFMVNVKTLKDLVAAAKASPGKISYSSAGTRSTGHLIGALLASSAGIDWTHIGYKGFGPATTDFMAGRLSVLFGSVTNDLELRQQGKLLILANTAPARPAKYPDVPTVAQAGFPELEITSWGGLIGPGGIPAPIARRLASELEAAIDKPDVQKVVNTMSIAYRGTADELQKRYLRDYEVYARVIREAKITVE
jgi:tripartite-type tricarboxylate transporter receptor subunit TctC